MRSSNFLLGIMLLISSTLANVAYSQNLNSTTDINATEPDGTSLLMQAIYERDENTALNLIAAGADVSLSNRYGINALILAARRGSPELMRQLLNAGADPNSATPEGETALMSAAKVGNSQVVELLLAGTDQPTYFEYANPNALESWKGQTALMWAAAFGHSDVIRVLASHGAELDLHSAMINIPTVDPAHFQGGFVYGVIPRGRMTALHFAAREGQLASIEALIEVGTDLNSVDDFGTTPLIIAAINRNMDIAGLLLNEGADPNISDKWGRTVLFVATDMNTIDAHPRPVPMPTDELTSLDIVKLALEKGADHSPLLAEGLPPLMTLGGTSNSLLNEGSTPLFRASMSGDLEIISLLLNAGADPTIATAEREGREFGGITRPSNGRTSPLMAAAGIGWRDGVSRGREMDAVITIDKYINEFEADINAANQSGDTALHGAVGRASLPIIKVLIENGAEFHVKNARGTSPVEMAEAQLEQNNDEYEPIVALLHEFMPPKPPEPEPEEEIEPIEAGSETVSESEESLEPLATAPL